ncbi:MAG: DUF3179 domain-containing protein [Acidobacteria bacterium]|nr:DUF3179 domain-containing protein [Acidobacteriota bacterium]
MVPTINGRMGHFKNVGLYDGLFVMQDTETKTLWNHITGEALYGPLVGKSLGPLGNVLQMTVKQALTLDPDVRVAISDRVYFVNGRQMGTAPTFGGRGPQPGGGHRLGTDATLSDMFITTLGKEDTRRPRMDLGLGVWTEKTRRYYPMDRIRERGEAFIDRIDSRPVLVYVDPDTFMPAAVFVNAKTARLQNKEVRLDNGQVVRSGLLVDVHGKRQSADRPQQVFTRWYGFALTFPGAEVFGQ